MKSLLILMAMAKPILTLILIIHICSTASHSEDQISLDSEQNLRPLHDDALLESKQQWKRATIIINDSNSKIYDDMEEEIAAVFSKVAFDGVGLHTGYIPRRPLVPVVALTAAPPPIPTTTSSPSTKSPLASVSPTPTQRFYINSPKLSENDPVEEIKRRYTPRPYLPLTPFPDLNWFAKVSHPPPPVFNPIEIFGSRNNKNGRNETESEEVDVENKDEENGEVDETTKEKSDGDVHAETSNMTMILNRGEELPTSGEPSTSSTPLIITTSATFNYSSSYPTTPQNNHPSSTENMKSYQLSFPIIPKYNTSLDVDSTETSPTGVVVDSEIDFDKVLETYGIAWPAHIYFVGIMFLILAVLSIVCTCFFRSSVKIMTSRYFSVFHILIFLLAFSRTVSFFTDPYNINHIYPQAFGNLVFNVGFPCLTSALGITVLALYRTSEIRPWGNTQKSLSLLWLLIVIQFLVIMCAEIVSGFIPSIRLISLFCPVITILWLIILSCAYFYIFSKTVRKKTWKEPPSNGKAQERLQKMGFVFKTNKISSLTLGFNIVLWVCVLAMTLALVLTFGLSGLFEVKAGSDPFPWWIYQLCVRILELFMAYMLVFVSCLKVDKSVLDRNGDKVAQVYSIITCSNYCNGHTLFCGNKLKGNTEKENVYTLNPDPTQAVTTADIYYSQAITCNENQMAYEKISSPNCQHIGPRPFECRHCRSCTSAREILPGSSLNSHQNICSENKGLSSRRGTPVEGQDYELKEESDSTCTYEAISETSLKVNLNTRDFVPAANIQRVGITQGDVKKLMAGELSLTDSLCFYPTSKHRQIHPSYPKDMMNMNMCNSISEIRGSGRCVSDHVFPVQSSETHLYGAEIKYPQCYTNRVRVDDSGVISELKRSPPESRHVDSQLQNSSCGLPLHPQIRTKGDCHYP